MKRLGLALVLLLISAGTVSAVDVIENLGVDLNLSGHGGGPIWFPFLVHWNSTSHGDGYYIANMYKARAPFVAILTLSDGSTVQITDGDFVQVQKIHISGKNLYMYKLTKNLPSTPTKIHWISFVGYQLNTTYPVLEALNFALVKEGQSFVYPTDGRTVEIYAVFSAVNWGNFKKVTGYFDGVPTSDAWYLLRITDDDGTVSVSDASSYGSGAIMVAVMKFSVQFSIKDALTGQALSGVTVKEDSTVLGTIDDGGTLELMKGQHKLTFEKQGYWSVTKTIDVQDDMTVSVEMYPSSAAFKLENFPSDITIPENTIYELTFTLSPIDTSATYNTYLSISGLSNVLEVRKDGSLISEESGKYYLGDIEAPVSITIRFKASGVGQHTFSITVTSQNLLGTNTYTTTKQTVYEVHPLPFAITLPSEWQVGDNEIRISETQGNQLPVLLILKDSEGNEVWSGSYIFQPYEAHTFSAQVPREGNYLLEVQFNGFIALFDVKVNPVISLITKQITVSEGGEGTITLHFNNPSSNVKYYTIVISGGFLPSEVNQTVSIAPLTEKDVSIALAVPEDLTYDAYEICVSVYEGDALVFSDKVAVTVTEDSGFSLPIGGGNNSWLIYGIAGLIVLAIITALARR